MSSPTKNPDDHKPVYGVGTCQPKPLQCLANPKAFTANLALAMLMQVCIFSYAIGVVRTLEKRFSLTSKQTGVLNSTNDVIQVFVVITIGYFARKAHKPRVLSISLLVLATGCFIYAIPYFLFGTKEDIIKRSDDALNKTSTPGPPLCSADNYKEDGEICNDSSTHLVESNSAAFSMFICAAILIGLGGSGLQVMGISYIDENVKHEYTSLYIGAAMAMYPLGPIFGFLFAALATSLPENLKFSVLEPSDPAFIGAWWLGYVIFPVVLFVFSIPLFFFPKHFPEYYRQKAIQNAKNNESDKNDKSDKKEELSQTGEERKSSKEGILSLICRELKEFPKSFIRLMSRPEYITNAVSNIFLVYLIVGLGINIPRYLEIYFLQPAYITNIITAISGASSGVVGTVMGGVLVRKLRLKLQGIALMSTVTTVFSLCGVIVLMLITCQKVELASQLNDKGMLDIDIPCKSQCSCPRDLYLPVCGETSGGKSEKLTFLSPCHAGCQTRNESWVYTNCSCLASPLETPTRGTCMEPCKMVYLYALVLFLMSMSGSTGRVPSTIVNLRVVDQDLRPFALGFHSFLINLLAFIPAPIMYGALTDSACLVWSKNCGKTGNCLFYDTNKYRLLIHGMTLVFVIIGLGCSILTLFLIRRNTKRGVYDHIDNKSTTNESNANDSKNGSETNRQNSIDEQNNINLKDGSALKEDILSQTHL